jgi:hypothetical protein
MFRVCMSAFPPFSGSMLLIRRRESSTGSKATSGNGLLHLIDDLDRGALFELTEKE